MYQTHYYVTYLTACAVLIAGLAIVLHRAGAVFLDDTFSGNPQMRRAVVHLLDIGYYLICAGYVAVTYRTFDPMNDLGQLTLIVSIKLGIFLLLLGALHLFNLLVLAISRRRLNGRIAHTASPLS
jgi:hypothetical protein